MDLRAAEACTLQPRQRHAVPTGLRVAIPDGWEGQIRPRSGLAFRHGLSIPNAPGTIDSDYRGELKVLLINLGDAPLGDDSAFAERSVPGLRNLSRANMAFTDGHVEAMSLEAIDDSDGNGQVDNGNWNGLGRGDTNP